MSDLTDQEFNDLKEVIASTENKVNEIQSQISLIDEALRTSEGRERLPLLRERELLFQGKATAENASHQALMRITLSVLSQLNLGGGENE